MTLLGEYINALKTPPLTEAVRPVSGKQASREILSLYSLHVILVVVAGLVISQLVSQQDNLLSAVLEEMPVWLGFSLAVVVAPVVEEMIFRLPLQPSAVNLALPLSVLALVSIGAAGGVGVLTVLSLVLASYNAYLWVKQPQVPLLRRLYDRFPRVIFYGLAIAFGIVHIGNYREGVWALLPLLVLPQCILGVFFGYVRLRYGLVWAMLTHAFHNACFTVPLFVLQLLGSPALLTGLGGDLDPRTLGGLDRVLLAVTGLYFIGGPVVCAVVALKLFKAASRSR